MTIERWMELMSNDDLKLTRAEIDSGWHFCPEMDGLLADSSDPHGDCYCGLNKKRSQNENEHTCTCDWCTKWSPVVKRINSALPDGLKTEFDELLNHYFSAEMDGSVAESKLNGTWPGWEWLPGAIAEHEKLK